MNLFLITCYTVTGFSVLRVSGSVKRDLIRIPKGLRYLKA